MCSNVKIRKSSCVNARGIPTAAYQVLHLLSCTGGGYPCLRVYPIPGRGGGGVPPIWTWPVVSPGQVEYPSLPAGPGWGTPPPCQLGYPPPTAGPGQGTPGQVGYPSLWTDGWLNGWTDTCENITFPSYYVRGR